MAVRVVRVTTILFQEASEHELHFNLHVCVPSTVVQHHHLNIIQLFNMHTVATCAVSEVWG